MELRKKEEIFWDNGAPRSIYVLPIRGGSGGNLEMYNFENLLEGKGAKVIPNHWIHESRLKNLLTLAVENRGHTAVYQDHSSFMRYDETLFVFQEGKPQALVTHEWLPSYKDPGYRKKHMVLEVREGYELADEMLELLFSRAEIPLAVR